MKVRAADIPTETNESRPLQIGTDHWRFHRPHAHLATPFGTDWFARQAETFARFFGTPLFFVWANHRRRNIDRCKYIWSDTVRPLSLYLAQSCLQPSSGLCSTVDIVGAGASGTARQSPRRGRCAASGRTRRGQRTANVDCRAKRGTNADATQAKH